VDISLPYRRIERWADAAASASETSDHTPCIISINTAIPRKLNIYVIIMILRAWIVHAFGLYRSR